LAAEQLTAADFDESQVDAFVAARAAAGYRQWMFLERDLAAMRVLRCENLARRFLQLGQPAGSLMDLSALSGVDVSAFIPAESRRVSVGSARGRVAEMRSLLRYWAVAGFSDSGISGFFYAAKAGCG
jgi:hypothetical protein